ncbi:TetR family transcriptional regulator [Gordonia sp. DT30]|uniref:TetR family transcriptional regulator n=1 Tax=unclassified Gordonia (in: high G+C Gram-positive bacteria) TaxID=2657482 RepID=UPI003CEE8AD0
MAEQAVGAAVRRARERAGMTLRDLAGHLGVSAGTMSAIENNKVAVTVERLNAVAAALGVTATALLARDTAMAPPTPARGDDDWRHFADLDLDPVLAAAVEVFTETGYHGATMRVVAGAAGISVAGIYHHYRSKQQLLVALFDVMMNEVHWRMTAAASETPDPVTTFALMVEALTLCHTQRRDLAFIAATEMRSLVEPDRSRVADERRRVQHHLDVVAAKAVATGAFTTPNPHNTGRAIATMCMALPYWFSVSGPQSPAEVAAEYADLALAMMGRRVQPD